MLAVRDHDARVKDQRLPRRPDALAELGIFRDTGAGVLVVKTAEVEENIPTDCGYARIEHADTFAIRREPCIRETHPQVLEIAEKIPERNLSRQYAHHAGDPV